MTRKELFLIAQAVLCTVIAVLLTAGAVCLYLDGAAKQAEGDLFFYIFTRGRVGVKLFPVLPLIFLSLGLSVTGWILGIKDENAEKPVRNEKLLRDPGSIQNKAVLRQTDPKAGILRKAVLVIALILIAIGILNGGLEDVLAKGAAVCAECIGLG